MTDSVSDIEQAIIDEFSVFGDDWTMKYEHLMDQARLLQPLPEKFRKDVFLISGCQSQVWLAAEKKEEVYTFYADSNALITKGMIALLIRVIQNQPASVILNHPFNFIKAIGLQNQLSPTRANGLRSMIQRIQHWVK